MSGFLVTAMHLSDADTRYCLEEIIPQADHTFCPSHGEAPSGCRLYSDVCCVAGLPSLLTLHHQGRWLCVCDLSQMSIYRRDHMTCLIIKGKTPPCVQGNDISFSDMGENPERVVLRIRTAFASPQTMSCSIQFLAFMYRLQTTRDLQLQEN